MTGVHLDIPLGNLPVKRLIGPQQELLAGLPAGIESTAHQHTPEGAVVEQSAVFPCKGNPLSHTLVDDVGRYFCQAIYIGFAGPVVTPLDGVVKEPVYRVVVVLVVLGGIDPPLGGNGMGATRTVLVAKSFYIVTQLRQRSSGGCSSQTSSHDDDLQFSLVGRTYHPDGGFVPGPLFRQRSGWYL